MWRAQGGGGGMRKDGWMDGWMDVLRSLLLNRISETARHLADMFHCPTSRIGMEGRKRWERKSCRLSAQRSRRVP